MKWRMRRMFRHSSAYWVSSLHLPSAAALAGLTKPGRRIKKILGGKEMAFSARALAFAVGSLIVSPTIAAAARDWYILDFGKGRCVQAKKFLPQAPTPEKFHAASREQGLVDTVHVEKDEDGNVVLVTIGEGAGENAVTLFWFPTADLCDAGKKKAEALGYLPDQEDLK
jgi:hypothetical protein